MFLQVKQSPTNDLWQLISNVWACGLPGVEGGLQRAQTRCLQDRGHVDPFLPPFPSFLLPQPEQTGHEECWRLLLSSFVATKRHQMGPAPDTGSLGARSQFSDSREPAKCPLAWCIACLPHRYSNHSESAGRCWPALLGDLRDSDDSAVLLLTEPSHGVGNRRRGATCRWTRHRELVVSR